MVQIELGDITIDVEQKNIKNIHLSVYPPNGKVKISAPDHMNLDTIRVFAISKIKWIRNKQKELKEQPRETIREFISKESHYLFGKRYLLKVIVSDMPYRVDLTHGEIVLYVKPSTTTERKKELVDEWYRQQLKSKVPELINKWEKVIGVKINEYGIKKMRTKWGTCNPVAKRIWLNLELAKKPIETIEYIIVHELVHLLEPSHNNQFIKYMDEFMPKWKFYRDELNQLPFGHIEWKY